MDRKNILVGAGIIVIALVLLLIGLAILSSDETVSQTYSPSVVMAGQYAVQPQEYVMRGEEKNCHSKVTGYVNYKPQRECTNGNTYVKQENDNTGTRIYVSTHNSYGYPRSYSRDYYRSPYYKYPYDGTYGNTYRPRYGGYNSYGYHFNYY